MFVEIESHSIKRCATARVCLFCVVGCLAAAFVTNAIAQEAAPVELGQQSKALVQQNGTSVGAAQTEQAPNQVGEIGYCGGVIMIPTNQTSPKSNILGPFTILSTFTSNVTAAQRTVILQAVAEWEGLIQTAGVNPNQYPISFTFDPLAGFPPNVEAVAATNYNIDGTLAFATIEFKDSIPWFVDPTPNDDSEFSSSPPPSGVDLLTVARHEIGHAVGWNRSPLVTQFWSNGVFDAPRLNIGTTSEVDSMGNTVFEGHADPMAHPGDVMVPALPPSVRRSISLYPDVAFTARAFIYDIPARFVDPAYTGPETGAASKPWNTFEEGATLTPNGVPVYLSNGSYILQSIPFVSSTPVQMRSVRGPGAVVN